MLVYPVTIFNQVSSSSVLPTDFSNLYGWWDFSDTGRLSFSGSNIIGVGDKSSNVNNMVLLDGAGAALGTGTVNGNSYATFSANSYQVSGATTFDDFTLVGVFRCTAGSTNADRILDHSYINGWWMGQAAINTDYFGGGIKEASDPYGTYVSGVRFVHSILVMRRNDVTKYVNFNNGNSVSASCVNTTTSSGTVAMGGTNTSIGSLWRGDIDETIIYKRYLTNTEINSLCGYLATKWGLSWPAI